MVYKFDYGILIFCPINEFHWNRRWKNTLTLKTIEHSYMKHNVRFPGFSLRRKSHNLYRCDCRVNYPKLMLPSYSFNHFFLFSLFDLFDYAIGSYLTAKVELEQQNSMLRKGGRLEGKKAEWSIREKRKNKQQK